jgi:tetratricopeptide (TPR) repeat protein
MPASRRLVSWLVGAMLVLPLAAHAQDSKDGEGKPENGQNAEGEEDKSDSAKRTLLERAETAYLNIRYRKARKSAIKALESGGHSPKEVLRLYELIGITSASLGDSERAKEIFIKMLALDSDADVTDALAPRFRNPYLEALGFWRAQGQHFSVEVELRETRGRLVVRLNDPLEMANAIRVHTRIEGESDYSESVVQPGPRVNVPVEGLDEGSRVEYALRVLDEYGNELAAQGTLADPRIIGELPAPAVAGAAPKEDRPLIRSPWLWSGVAAGLAGLAVGGVFLFQETTHQGQTTVSFGAR